MRRTTIFLEAGLLRKAQQAARKQGTSFAHLVREAVVAYLAREGPMSAKLPSITGQFASGRSDLSERVDELLWKDPHQ